MKVPEFIKQLQELEDQDLEIFVAGYSLRTPIIEKTRRSKKCDRESYREVHRIGVECYVIRSCK